MELKNLKPELLWKHFDEIRKIPRCSKNEEKIREYVVNFAKKLGFSYKTDKAGNVVIEKPATHGKESSPITIVQAHMDMVCEKNEDVTHDFTKDPIRVKIEGEWVKAEGTTLGADNGIGVAACLALLEENEISHPPLEILLTVDEETGLTGAFQLDPSFLKGKILLNLDSEEEGVFIIGCAGGADTEYVIPVKRTDKLYNDVKILKIKGLKGGHSGVDIDKERANAIKILARILYEIKDRIEIAEIKGGDKRNAIPREATVVFASENYKEIEEKVKELEKEIKNEIEKREPEFFIEISNYEKKVRCIACEDKDKVIRFLLLLPHGVLSTSPVINGLVETSTNLAVIRTENEKIKIIESSRSSLDSALSFVRKVLKAGGELIGAKVHQPEGYPGWTPNPESEILKKAVKVYEKLFGKKPQIKAVHAGLETGIIGKKFPGMDMLSFGATIKDLHSPNERVHIPSVERFYRFLKELLEEI